MPLRRARRNGSRQECSAPCHAETRNKVLTETSSRNGQGPDRCSGGQGAAVPRPAYLRWRRVRRGARQAQGRGGSRRVYGRGCAEASRPTGQQGARVARSRQECRLFFSAALDLPWKTSVCIATAPHPSPGYLECGWWKRFSDPARCSGRWAGRAHGGTKCLGITPNGSMRNRRRGVVAPISGDFQRPQRRPGSSCRISGRFRARSTGWGAGSGITGRCAALHLRAWRLGRLSRGVPARRLDSSSGGGPVGRQPGGARERRSSLNIRADPDPRCRVTWISVRSSWPTSSRRIAMAAGGRRCGQGPPAGRVANRELRRYDDPCVL